MTPPPPFEPDPWVQTILTGMNVVIVAGLVVLAALYVIDRFSDDD